MGTLMRIRVSQWEYGYPNENTGITVGIWVLWRACGYCGGHVVAVEDMWVLWRACGCYGGHVGAMEGMWVL